MVSVMTEKELEAERRYRFHERIGIMCGAGIPTKEQIRTDREEAEAAIRKLRGK